MSTREFDIQFEMKRRNFLAEKGDFFAIEDKSHEGSGSAYQFAKELADRESKVEKATVRGLESMAWATDSVADILDYIRVRAGRDRQGRDWGKDQVGLKLAKELEGLRAQADKFVKAEKITIADAVRQLHLDLCREYIKHLAAHYEVHKSGVFHE